MKKLILYLVLFLLGIACQEKSEEQDIQGTDSSASKIEGSIDFKPDTTIIPIDSTDAKKLLYSLKFDEVKKYLYERVIENTITVESDSVYKRYEGTRIINNIDVKLIDINKDGSYDIDITITDFYLDLFANGVMKKFSSDSNISLEDQKQLAFDIATLDRPFRISINRNGQLYVIGKSEEIVTKYLELTNQGAMVSAIDRKPYRDELHERILSPIIRQLFRKLPEDNIKSGSIWIDGLATKYKNYDIDNIIAYAVEGFPKESDSDIVKIAIRLDSQAKKNLTAKEDSLEKVIEEPTFAGAGYFNFNITEGLITESETVSRRTTKFESERRVNTVLKKDIVYSEALTKNTLKLLN